MGFAYTRRYRLDVILAELPLWDATTWQASMPFFVPVILLAVALDADLAAADHATRMAAATLRAIDHGRMQRSWGRSRGSGFTDTIEDIGFSPNLTQTAADGTPTLRGDQWVRLPPDQSEAPFGQVLHRSTD
jgi:hypothetical protein